MSWLLLLLLMLLLRLLLLLVVVLLFSVPSCSHSYSVGVHGSLRASSSSGWTKSCGRSSGPASRARLKTGSSQLHVFAVAGDVVRCSSVQMMALYESEESESLNETLVAQGVARVASNAEKLATSQVRAGYI